MKVHITLQGDLIKFLKGQPQAELSVQTGWRVTDVLADLGMEPGDFWHASVNGLLVDDDAGLSDGDRLVVYPPIGGGTGERRVLTGSPVPGGPMWSELGRRAPAGTEGRVVFQRVAPSSSRAACIRCLE